MPRRSPRTFGTIRRLPSGRFQATYVGADSKRYPAPTTFLNRTDADGWLSLRQAEIVAGRWRPPTEDEPVVVDAEPETLTLGAYAETWLKERTLATRTRKHYRNLLDRFILPTLGNHDIIVTPSEIRTWYSRMGVGTPTQRAHTYGLLHAIFATAIDDGVVPISNPCRIKGADSVDRVVIIRPASVDELEIVVNAMPPRLQLMVLLASWTSLRFGELTELRRKDINARDGIVHVRRGVVHPDGVCTVTTPKSPAGRRDVAIPPHMLPAVVEHLKDHTDPGRDSLLFPPSLGGCHLMPSSLYRVYYPARRKAGRPDLRFHDLRHTGGTMYAQSGATLAELMTRLGHSTVGAAMRYQHVVNGRDAEIAQRLSALATVTNIDSRRRIKDEGLSRTAGTA